MQHHRVTREQYACSCRSLLDAGGPGGRQRCAVHAQPYDRAPAPAGSLDGGQTFTSEGAKTQVGNDAFLNEDLMGRAIRGPGVVNKSKLKIAVVGAGLAGMVAAMDLVDAGHEVELFELRPFVGGKVSSWRDNPNRNPNQRMGPALL